MLKYFRDTPVPLKYFFEIIKNPKPRKLKNQTRARQNQANVAREEIYLTGIF